jgi:hypothetical protein
VIAATTTKQHGDLTRCEIGATFERWSLARDDSVLHHRWRGWPMLLGRVDPEQTTDINHLRIQPDCLIEATYHVGSA